MEKKNKIILAAFILVFVLISALAMISFSYIDDLKKGFDARLSAQQEDYNSRLISLSEDFNDSIATNIEMLQNLIKSIDQANQQRDKSIVDSFTRSVSKLQNESQASLASAKAELQKEISNVEVSNTDFSKIAQQSLPGVVSVLTNVGQGSGAFIEENGTIVTNYHVIKGAKTINVLTYSKDLYNVYVVGYDEDIDIAVLQINTNETFKRLKFGDSDDVKVGESVIALGNPYGLDFTVTQGIISARRKAENNIEYLQIDVPINPGNSGGPIIDSTGSIIGIANFRVQGGEGLGFALPSNTAKDTAYDIIEG